jgi:hypothetical protein
MQKFFGRRAAIRFKYLAGWNADDKIFSACAPDGISLRNVLFEKGLFGFYIIKIKHGLKVFKPFSTSLLKTGFSLKI